MTAPDTTRFQQAIQAIDNANREDPFRETDAASGREEAKEYLYARRMSECLDRFATDASEALRLAVRAQHIRRWSVPRGDYPMDRKGYLQWRERLKKLHAELAAEILRAAGYDETTSARVSSLIRKENLKTDAEAQTLEDVACLVFIEFYLEPFARAHDDEKIVAIIKKTWGKMSDRARAAAMDLMPRVSEHTRNLIRSAVS